MKDILVILVVAGILALALGYVIRQKKKGVKCIGCPEGGKCAQSACSGCTGCGSYGCSCQEMK